VGGPAAPFTLNDLEGHPVTLADYQGKVVLLTFWATWCGPCKQEMPEIETAYERHKDRGFIVLAVNFGEREEAVRTFVRQKGLTFPVLLNRNGNVASRYGVVSLPISFFIDQHGIIRERVFGGTLTAESISEALRQLQEEKG
jgi:peroxiredoxin